MPRFALIQFAKHVRIFTSCLAHLLGKAPDIRDRVVLFDNLREELGGGTLGESHYMLYMRMLDSIGISADLETAWVGCRVGMPRLVLRGVFGGGRLPAMTAR